MASIPSAQQKIVLEEAISTLANLGHTHLAHALSSIIQPPAQPGIANQTLGPELGPNKPLSVATHLAPHHQDTSGSDPATIYQQVPAETFPGFSPCLPENDQTLNFGNAFDWDVPPSQSVPSFPVNPALLLRVEQDCSPLIQTCPDSSLFAPMGQQGTAAERFAFQFLPGSDPCMSNAGQFAPTPNAINPCQSILASHPWSQRSTPIDQVPKLGSAGCFKVQHKSNQDSSLIELDQFDRAQLDRKLIKRGPGNKQPEHTRKRRLLTNKESKEETRLTRDNKACMRCHLHRIRLLGPTENFVWSRRWLGKGLKEITTWQSDKLRWVTLTQGHSDTTIRLAVKKFVPIPGDRLTYSWETTEGTKSLKCPPYAIANIQEASEELKRHVDNATAQYVLTFINGKHNILGKTFSMILSLIDHDSPMQGRELLRDTLRLWVASRFIETPWRVFDDETLDHELELSHPFTDPESPYFGHIPVTPVMDNQLDQIIIRNILQPLKKSTQARLQKFIETNKPENWLLVYLCSFILLNNYEIATVHDRNFALRHSLTTRFSNYPLLEGFHCGAKTILAHFHYCCKGDAPFQLDWANSNQTRAVALTTEQREYMQDIVHTVTAEGGDWKMMKRSEEYDADIYFISQLFDHDWEPTDTL